MICPGCGHNHNDAEVPKAACLIVCKLCGAQLWGPQHRDYWLKDKLIPGAFYWVQPVFDPDFTPRVEVTDEIRPAVHWHNREQPALFYGYSEDGSERWVYLENEPSRWPVCRVGKEIKNEF